MLVSVSVVMAVAMAVACGLGTCDESDERGCADGGQFQLHCDCYWTRRL